MVYLLVSRIKSVDFSSSGLKSPSQLWENHIYILIYIVILHHKYDGRITKTFDLLDEAAQDFQHAVYFFLLKYIDNTLSKQKSTHMCFFVKYMSWWGLREVMYFTSHGFHSHQRKKKRSRMIEQLPKNA